jgi:lysophospholipid acyltransferase (LPLAT)-like uncharacterized protein
MFSVTKVLSTKWCQRFLYYFIQLYALTFRLHVENEEQWTDYFKNGGRVLLCTWHQQFFSAIGYFKKYQSYEPAIMISRSADGDMIAGIAQLSGWFPVRGSSSKGGGIALKKLVIRLTKTGLAGHIMDGPRGPIGKVKAGAVRLALDAEAVIVPFYISSNRSWFFNSWDRFFVPKPFAKVTLKFGNLIPLSKPASARDFEAQRQKIEDIMALELRYPSKKA